MVANRIYISGAIAAFMLDSDASTAKTLTLVAIILQVVFFVIGLFVVLGFVIAMTTYTAPGVVTTTGPSPFLFTGIFGAIFLVGLLWILLDYFLIYKKLVEEKVEEAESPALILGIIQLLFGGFITGILLIVAYVKIKDSVRNRQQAATMAPQRPVS